MSEGKKHRPTKAQIAQRVEGVLRIRLDGAEFWDVLHYIAEKQQAGEQPWIVPDDAKPCAERTIWLYIARADKLIAESCRASRKKLLRRHLAQRRNLYAKAVSQGDLRASLSCLDSEAKLTGLLDEELNRIVEKLAKEIAELKASYGNRPPQTPDANAS